MIVKTSQKVYCELYWPTSTCVRSPVVLVIGKIIDGPVPVWNLSSNDDIMESDMTEDERRSTCVSPNLRLPLTSPSYSPELSSFLLRNNSVLNVSSDLEFCCCRVRAGKLRRQTRDNLHHIVRFNSQTLTMTMFYATCCASSLLLHLAILQRNNSVGDHCSKPSGKG